LSEQEERELEEYIAKWKKLAIKRRKVDNKDCRFPWQAFCVLDKELCPEGEPRSDCLHDEILEGAKRGLEAYQFKPWSEVKWVCKS